MTDNEGHVTTYRHNFRLQEKNKDQNSPFQNKKMIIHIKSTPERYLWKIVRLLNNKDQ